MSGCIIQPNLYFFLIGAVTRQVHSGPGEKTTQSPAENAADSLPSFTLTVASPSRMKQVSCASYFQGNSETSFSQIGQLSASFFSSSVGFRTSIFIIYRVSGELNTYFIP